MRTYGDEELQSLLLYQGYRVPLVVMRTWGSNAVHRTNRRGEVERWMRFMLRENNHRPGPFPKFLSMFEIAITRSTQAEAKYEQRRNGEKRPVQKATL